MIASVCRESAAAWKCPPRLVAAPDHPVPFAPGVESYYRPNSRRIQEMRRADGSATLMDAKLFKMPLYLPAQGASETEATIIEWHVAEGDHFCKGQAWRRSTVQSRFRFRGPLRRPGHPASAPGRRGRVAGRADHGDRDRRPGAARLDSARRGREQPAAQSQPAAQAAAAPRETIGLLGFGGYVPQRIVTNEELVANFPEITAEYVYQVTGIRLRRWAAKDEKPSDMAYKAALEAIRRCGIAAKDIDAVVVATTTPDMAMPSTAAILQDRLNLQTVPAFDLNAACSGWLYAVSMAQGMILSGTARNVLTVGVDMQSQLLDKSDRSAYFLFGDGAGAAIVSCRPASGIASTRWFWAPIPAACTWPAATSPATPSATANDGRPLDPHRGAGPVPPATESFTAIIRQALAKSGWTAEQTRWVIPHQANGRILKAAAKHSGVGFDRFYLNVEHVGNTSSASIPLAIIEIDESLKPGDKLVLCSRRRRPDGRRGLRRVVKGTGTAGPADASLTWRTSSHRPKARLHPRTFPARPRAKTISLPHLEGSTRAALSWIVAEIAAIAPAASPLLPLTEAISEYLDCFQFSSRACDIASSARFSVTCTPLASRSSVWTAAI